MHRRISSVFEFKPPNHVQRHKIWQLHTANQIKVDPGVDLSKIALRYELTGGFIKNAISSALMSAIARDGPEAPIVSLADIVTGYVTMLLD